MKTGKMQIDIDGDNYTFNFGKSGSNKGAGKTGEDDKKYYNSGKLMAAGKDEKMCIRDSAGAAQSLCLGLSMGCKGFGFSGIPWNEFADSAQE